MPSDTRSKASGHGSRRRPRCPTAPDQPQRTLEGPGHARRLTSVSIFVSTGPAADPNRPCLRAIVGSDTRNHKPRVRGSSLIRHGEGPCYRNARKLGPCSDPLGANCWGHAPAPVNFKPTDERPAWPCSASGSRSYARSCSTHQRQGALPGDVHEIPPDKARTVAVGPSEAVVI
jgi:hypothetical protein